MNKYSDGRKRIVTAYIVHAIAPDEKSAASPRAVESQVEEAEGLARAIDLKILSLKVVKVTRIHPGYFLGEGNRETIAAELEELKPDVVIVNNSLSPVQQRNLEREWKIKVIDRTGLILEIFSARAQSKEGRLQVELASLDYQRSRLVKMWSHLERQRGGAGFLGGPGETHKELDRRMIVDRIARIKKELEEVRRTRELGRKSRERVPFPVAAIVGYTNAGKSTLFNRMTGADVFAKDLLFATLDPTMRRIETKGGQQIILSDTVGFISDLPTHLVAAFRATLEQITYADIILHVIDISQEDSKAERDDVIKILADLGIDYEMDQRIIEVWNKIDAVPAAQRDKIKRRAPSNNAVAVSSLTGDGIEDLKDRIAALAAKDRIAARYKLDITDGKALAFLYQSAEVTKRRDHKKSMTIDVMIEPRDAQKFTERYGYEAVIIDE